MSISGNTLKLIPLLWMTYFPSFGSLIWSSKMPKIKSFKISPIKSNSWLFLSKVSSKIGSHVSLRVLFKPKSNAILMIKFQNFSMLNSSSNIFWKWKTLHPNFILWGSNRNWSLRFFQKIRLKFPNSSMTLRTVSISKIILFKSNITLIKFPILVSDN